MGKGGETSASGQRMRVKASAKTQMHLYLPARRQIQNFLDSVDDTPKPQALWSRGASNISSILWPRNDSEHAIGNPSKIKRNQKHHVRALTVTS